MSENQVQRVPAVPDYKFDSVECFKEGFEIFKKSPVIIVIYLVGLVVFNGLLRKLPMGSLLVFLISPLLTAGGLLLIDKVATTGSAILDDAFAIFRAKPLDQLVLTGIVSSLLIGLGFAFLLIPGIYLAVSYMLAMPYATFEREGFWEVLEKSRRIIGKKWWDFFKFLFLCLLVNILGACALGIGLLVTMPVSFCAWYVLYKKVSAQLAHSAPLHETPAP